jgi:pimeloyl-ACP methyl ester carboxylesterase
VIIKYWGEEWVTPALRKRLLANDTAALIACAQRPQATEKYSDVVGKIAVPTLVYAGSADPVHDPARQGASEIPGAQFVSLPGLNHPAANLRSDLVLPHVEPFLAKATGH